MITIRTLVPRPEQVQSLSSKVKQHVRISATNPNLQSVFYSQVSGDHQYPGRADLGSGSSQPGQEAVGPGCRLRVPGLLQPQQTRGRDTPAFALVSLLSVLSCTEVSLNPLSETFLYKLQSLSMNGCT